MRFWFIIIAVVVFLVGLIYVVTADAPDGQLLWGFTFGGLAAFAAGHITNPPPLP